MTTPAARARRFATETPLGRTRRARRMTRTLAEIWPDAVTELDFTTPLELVVATILSAQSTDKRVNEVTPALFAQLSDRRRLRRRRPGRAGGDDPTTGFFRNKTDPLIGLGQALVERFDGEVPRTLDELVTLPGIGRKTANVDPRQCVRHARASPSTRTSAGWSGAGGGPRRPTRSRSSARSPR